jgi:hypothetical protein
MVRIQTDFMTESLEHQDGALLMTPSRNPRETPEANSSELRSGEVRKDDPIGTMPHVRHRVPLSVNPRRPEDPGRPPERGSTAPTSPHGAHADPASASRLPGAESRTSQGRSRIRYIWKVRDDVLSPGRPQRSLGGTLPGQLGTAFPAVSARPRKEPRLKWHAS